MKISVIIPTYNRAKLLKKTLNSICNQSIDTNNYEIIVVDNNSTDNTCEVVNHLVKDRNNIIYFRETRQGLHYARNTGAKIANADILAFTDDDAIYESDWLEELLKVYTSFKNFEIGCVGGKVVPVWEELPPEWINLVPPGYLSLIDLGEEIKEVKEIYGLNFSIKRDLLLKIGGFNPEAFKDIWLGDGEMGVIKKVRQEGYKIFYTPYAIAKHFIPKERITFEYAKKRFFNQGKSVSYGSYKEKKHNIPILFFRCIAFAILILRYKFLSLIDVFLSSQNYYINETKVSFFKGRLCYEFRLIFDSDFKKFVLQEMWI